MLEAARPAITPETIESLFALAMGFAVAGMCSSGYRLFWRHFPSFRLLEVGPTASRFAAIPLLMIKADLRKIFLEDRLTRKRQSGLLRVTSPAQSSRVGTRAWASLAG